MSEIISGREFLTNKELEALIRSEKLSDVDAQKVRLDHARQRFQAFRQRGVEQAPGTARLGSGVSAGLSFGEGRGFGAASTGAAALTAPITSLRRGTSLGESFELNKQQSEMILGASPIARGVGEFASFLGPASLPGAVARGGFRLGGGALAKGAASLSARGAPAKAAATQIASAMTGSAGAITAINAAEYTLDGRSVSETAQDVVDQVTSPLNLVLSGGAGSLAAIARQVPEGAVMKLIDAARRKGFKISADVPREGGFIAGILNSLGVSPTGRATVAQFMNEGFFNPLRKAFSEIERGIRPGARARAEREFTGAAKDVRGLLVGPEGGVGTGSIQQGITAKGTAAFSEAAARGDVVPRDALGTLLKALGKIRKEAVPSAGPRGKEFKEVLEDHNFAGSLRNIIKGTLGGKGGGVTPQDLENIRGRISDALSFEARALNAVSSRDQRDLRKMYDAIREVQRRASPEIDTALKDIGLLRNVNDSLQPLVGSVGDDIQLVRSLFTAPDFQNRWREIQGVLTTEQIQRIRGVYLAEFFEEVALRQGAVESGKFFLNNQKMRRMFRGKSGPQFRRTVFDMVLPGARQRVLELADISSLFQRTIGRAEGSATARRQQDLELIRNTGEALGTAAGVMTGPDKPNFAIRILLGAAGMFGLTKSLTTGKLAQSMNTLATGGALQTPQVLSAASTRPGVAGQLPDIAGGNVLNRRERLFRRQRRQQQR